MPDDQKIQQAQFPYEEADGCARDRKDDLTMALLRIDADVYLSQLVRLLWELTHGGTVASPLLSNRQLAAKPWGLCCSDSKARATVARATGLGLVNRADTLRTLEGDRHSYQIHWPGVMALKLGRGAAAGLPSPASMEQGPASIEQGPASIEQGSRARSEGNFPSENSPQENLPSSFTPSPSFLEGESHTDGVKEGGRAWQRVPVEYSAIPEIVDAWPLRIAPLPPGKLVYDPFGLSAKDLTSIFVIRWFRQQLSLASPMTGNSGSELLLVIAAGRNAVKCPGVKSPRALFQAQIERGHWSHALRHIPAAAEFLGEVRSEFPECLVHSQGSGPRVNSEVHGVPSDASQA